MRTARAKAWNLECVGDAEGMGPAGNVRDDGGRTGKVQSVQDEDYMPNQQIWSFIQLAEKKKKAKSVFFRQVRYIAKEKK